MKKHLMIACLAYSLMATASLTFITAVSDAYGGDGAKISTHNLALMPFFIGKKTSEDQSVLDLKPEQLGTKEDVQPGADEIMTRLVQHALDMRFGNGTVSHEEMMRAYGMISDAPYLTPRQLVGRLAEQLGVEYIVAGNIWRFSERSGNSLASENPASVAFKLHLIHVPSHRRIWVEVYDKTQQALSENLFQASDFIKQKGQWVTAEELAKIGVRDLVERMPL